MNTKQVEELTGISRQNIRYYERQGLLEPAREDKNAYRDYSQEDVRRLKLIKMLRLLDMPLKEIENVLNGQVPLKEAVVIQRESLLAQQKQLQAAVEVCTSIYREKTENVDVDTYLGKMENMSQNGGVFARIVDDYKQVALDEQSRQISFYTVQAVNTPGEFEEELKKYAARQGMKFQMIKPGMYPEFSLDQIPYTGARILKEEGTGRASAQIVCIRESREELKKEISKGRRQVYQGVNTVSANIRRHRVKSALNIAVSFLTAIVLILYMGNLAGAKEQLHKLPDALKVSGQVWNLCGEMKNGLFIQPQMLEKVYETSHIEALAETAELLGMIQDGGGKDEEEDKNLQFLGVNRLDCIDGFEEVAITWADGWDWEKFQEAPGVCIVNKDLADKKGIGQQEKLLFSLGRYKQALSGVTLQWEPLQPAEMEVVGVTDFAEVDPDMILPDALLPLAYVKEIFEENDKTYFASSLSFTVKDPMELNALKEKMKEAGFQSVIQGSPSSYMGVGLRIEDTVFIETALNLEKNLSLLEGFLPFILLVTAMIGYIVPHLLVQGRREEYAIMRALGAGRKKCNILLFAEHCLLFAAGSAAGAVIGILFKAVGPVQGAAIWIIFMGCYALGAAAAIWMFGKFSVAAVLSHRD